MLTFWNCKMNEALLIVGMSSLRGYNDYAAQSLNFINGKTYAQRVSDLLNVTE